jgi:hypothetical protein
MADWPFTSPLLENITRGDIQESNIGMPYVGCPF